nr:MAG TPA: zipper dimerization domain transcription factor-like protein [Caudoviricetes sp.]
MGVLLASYAVFLLYATTYLQRKINQLKTQIRR